MHYIYKPLRIC